MSGTSYSQAVQKVDDYTAAAAVVAVTSAMSVVGNLNFLLLVVWLMVCGSVSDMTFQRSRLPVFVCIAYLSLWNLLYTRSIGVVGSIGVGLNSALCTVIAVNFTLLHDSRIFTRLTLQPAVTGLKAKRHIRPEREDTVLNKQDAKAIPSKEGMPRTTWRRLFWTLDLITGFRGVQWSWNHATSVQQQAILRNASPIHPPSFLFNSSRFLLDYFLIDCMKCAMIADPYFVGHITQPPPPYITAYITSPDAIYTYRTLLGAVGVALAVDYLFAFGVLIQVNILGTRILGLNASPIMFPPVWGSPSAILRKGLRGFWGETWHQMFRMHFVSLGDAVSGWKLRNGISVSGRGAGDKQSTARGAIRLATVFLLSGAFHACASYTLLGPTRPWSSFLFFALQPLGIGIQSICSWLVVGPYLSDSTSWWKLWVRQCSNLGFTVLWLWTFSGLLLDDLTSGGIWLSEPVPFSLIRGLGFSKQDNRFWCW
jgi:hypothetical protein